MVVLTLRVSCKCLLDALDFQGPLQVVKTLDISSPHYWLLNYPSSPMPPGVKGIQSAVLKILPLGETCDSDLNIILARKAVVTLGPEMCGSIVPQAEWFEKLNVLFPGTNSYLRMCWLKAIGGAWNTTCRMHEQIKWPCIFGCVDSKDEICHYLQCPIIWQLAREALLFSENHFSVGHRLCFIDCSLEKL